jgi:hypothetical protein
MLNDMHKPEAGLLALADRVVIVTGLDRRVDYEVMVATAIMGGRYEWDPDDQNHRYTTSVDAAISLIPEGWRMILDSDGCHCRLTKRDMSLRDANGLASDMPRAIVAAALRARHSLNLENARG